MSYPYLKELRGAPRLGVLITCDMSEKGSVGPKTFKDTVRNRGLFVANVDEPQSKKRTSVSARLESRVTLVNARLMRGEC